MSPKHANFLINTGGAKAADLENLGELVRKRVLDSTGHHARVGNHAGRATLAAVSKLEDPTRPKAGGDSLRRACRAGQQPASQC